MTQLRHLADGTLRGEPLALWTATLYDGPKRSAIWRTYHELLARTPFNDDFKSLRIATTAELVGPDRWHRSAIYNEFVRAQGCDVSVSADAVAQDREIPSRSRYRRL